MNEKESDEQLTYSQHSETLEIIEIVRKFPITDENTT